MSFEFITIITIILSIIALAAKTGIKYRKALVILCPINLFILILHIYFTYIVMFVDHNPIHSGWVVWMTFPIPFLSVIICSLALIKIKRQIKRSGQSGAEVNQSQPPTPSFPPPGGTALDK